MTENDKLMDVLSKWNGNVHFGGSGAIQNDALELLQYRALGTVEDLQRLKDESCGAYPTTDLNIKPKCFYQETNHNRYCGALGRGENDDEPIEACKKCCHCEFNILREEAAEALAKEDTANDK